MTELKYLESKGIKDNPRIIDSSGQATDFYLQDLLEDYTKQLTLTDVVKCYSEEDIEKAYDRGHENGYRKRIMVNRRMLQLLCFTTELDKVRFAQINK